MKRLAIALALTIVTFVLLTAEAEAAGPFQKWRAYGRPAPKATAKANAGFLRALPSYSRYESAEDAYPRYIGAFHSRYFNDLGVAPGDVGFRGNGAYWPAW